VAAVQKPIRRSPARDPQGRKEGWTESGNSREQWETGVYRAAAVFVVLVTVLLWTAWLLIDMLLKVAF